MEKNNHPILHQGSEDNLDQKKCRVTACEQLLSVLISAFTGAKNRVFISTSKQIE